MPAGLGFADGASPERSRRVSQVSKANHDPWGQTPNSEHALSTVLEDSRSDLAGGHPENQPKSSVRQLNRQEGDSDNDP